MSPMTIYSVSVAYEVNGRKYKKAINISANMYVALQGQETVEIVVLPDKPKVALLVSQVGSSDQP